MSEDLSYLTDEDLEAVDAIMEGSRDRQHGEAILQMWKEGREHQEEQTRSLLDLISRAHQAKAQDDQQ